MNVRKITYAAAVGALYAALTMLLAPISYGPVQLRLSEALCVLPYFFPSSAWGLFVGCFVSNLLSSAGIWDVALGSLATLLSSLLIASLGKRHGPKWLACVLPVLFNGVIVGFVLALTSAGGEAFGSLWLVCGGEVAVGEALVLFGLGLPGLVWLPGSRFFSHLRALYAKGDDRYD